MHHDLSLKPIWKPGAGFFEKLLRKNRPSGCQLSQGHRRQRAHPRRRGPFFGDARWEIEMLGKFWRITTEGLKFGERIFMWGLMLGSGSKHKNSWDSWMFIPPNMVIIGIDPSPLVDVDSGLRETHLGSKWLQQLAGVSGEWMSWWNSPRNVYGSN